MKFRVALAAVGSSALVVLTGCGNGPPPDQTGGGGGASGGGGGGGGGVELVTSGTAAKTVNATDSLKFEPASANLKSGDIVKFSNTGSVGHNVTFDSGAKSDTFSGGDAVMFKLAQAGTFKYQCTIHPGMNGTITVG